MFPKQTDVGILRLIANDLDEILRRIEGIVAELVVDDGKPGWKIERGDHLQPLIDQKETVSIGFDIVETFATECFFRQLDSIEQVGKAIE